MVAKITKAVIGLIGAVLMASILIYLLILATVQHTYAEIPLQEAETRVIESRIMEFVEFIPLRRNK